jgi:hypothetical protein
MEATFHGATDAYREERMPDAKCMGFTKKEIVQFEPPNIYNNPVVIFPTMEMRQEGYVRPAHGLVVLPGGAGTAEETFNFVSIFTNPANKHQHFPILFAGPETASGYFDAIDQFLQKVCGQRIRERYDIVLGNPAKAAGMMMKKVRDARKIRRSLGDDGPWYGSLHFPEEVQRHFIQTHESVEALNLKRKGQSPHELMREVAKAFNAIVMGDGSSERVTKLVKERGPFRIHGDPDIRDAMKDFLERFRQEGRLVARKNEEVCYEFVD